MVRHIGTCRVCTNGELVFGKRLDTGELFVECLERMTGYVDPLTIESSDRVRMESVGWETTEPTIDDLVARGMGDLVR